MNEPTPQSQTGELGDHSSDFEGARELRALAEIQQLAAGLLYVNARAALDAGADPSHVSLAAGLPDLDVRLAQENHFQLPAVTAALRLSQLASGIALSLVTEDQRRSSEA